MSTRAKEWYATDYDFRQLCGDAQSQARTESEQEFAAQLMLKANEHGIETYVSQKQLEWLCRIADHDVPKRRSGANA